MRLALSENKDQTIQELLNRAIEISSLRKNGKLVDGTMAAEQQGTLAALQAYLPSLAQEARSTQDKTLLGRFEKLNHDLGIVSTHAGLVYETYTPPKTTLEKTRDNIASFMFN